MWTKLSLRARLCVLLSAMTLTMLILGVGALVVYARYQLADEQEPRVAAAQEVVAALNHTLANVASPETTLAAFVAGLPKDGSIAFEDAALDPGIAEEAARASLSGGAPQWFINVLVVPELTTRYPVLVGGSRVGDIVFRSDLATDISEKWVIFLALIGASILLSIMAPLIAYWTVGATLAPLDDIGRMLTRLRAGDYGARLGCDGPPEITASCRQVNELAETLARLSGDNALLLRRMVVLQDEERRELARELHDELGPLLFAIRANTVVLLQARAGGSADDPATKVLEAAESLQQTNRRILDRLRPMHVQELGLKRSIEGLARDVERQNSRLHVATSIDSTTGLDRTAAETLYRVVQESLTNVLRHAAAGEVCIELRVRSSEVEVTISDDGVGFQTPLVLGRGLNGMRERIRALNGAFDLHRVNNRTVVHCVLPLISAPVDHGAALPAAVAVLKE